MDFLSDGAGWHANQKDDRPLIPAMTIESHELRCAARHMAVAASELSRRPDVPSELAARLAVAEAIFREQSEGADGDCRWASEGPAVRRTDGESVTLLALAASAIRRERKVFPHRSIDREVVHGAKELLLGVRWYLPKESAESDPPVPPDSPAPK